MSRFVNRGFMATLLVVIIVAELALRVAASAQPATVRIVYGTTLAMYMEIDKRLRDAAPEIRVLALGDSLGMTQFQPDIFAADLDQPPQTVFNASYLATTFRSQENLLLHVGLDRLTQLRRVVMFINPRRLTPDGNIDAPIFRIAIPDHDGVMRSSWRERSVAPLFDRSRLYGLSRYLVSASWRQIGRPPSWDQVEYLSPQGGVAFDQPRPAGDYPVYLFETIEQVDERYVADLERVINLFRSRSVDVLLVPSVHHPSIQFFSSAVAAEQFEARMRELANKTGAVWVPLPAGFEVPADTDYLDYGHLNRAGGVAFTHYLRERLPE